MPYLRGKQEEQLAVLEVDQSVFLNEKVVPLFEPHSTSKTCFARYVKMCQSNRPFILIINPKVTNSPTQAEVEALINSYGLAEHQNFYVGLLVDRTTSQANLDQLINFLPSNQKVLIHIGDYLNPQYFSSINQNIYLHLFEEGRVTNSYIQTASSGTMKALLRDGFNRLPRNADYRGTEFFSDLYYTHQTDGYDGFGDFLTIGDYFQLNGGPAYAVALHITSNSNNTIEVSHFVSTSNSGPSNPGGKFGEALDALIAHHGNYPFFNSSGMQEFEDLDISGHFPGLGKVKRYSMMHHIELVASLI